MGAEREAAAPSTPILQLRPTLKRKWAQNFPRFSESEKNAPGVA